MTSADLIRKSLICFFLYQDSIARVWWGFSHLALNGLQWWMVVPGAEEFQWLWRPGPAWVPPWADWAVKQVGSCSQSRQPVLRRDLCVSSSKVPSPKCLSGTSTRKGLVKPWCLQKQRSPKWALAVPVHTGVDPPYCVRSYCSDLKRRIRGFFLQCPYFESPNVIEFVWFISGGEASVGYSLFYLLWFLLKHLTVEDGLSPVSLHPFRRTVHFR